MVVDGFNVFYGVAGLKAFDSVMVLMISLVSRVFTVPFGIPAFEAVVDIDVFAAVHRIVEVLFFDCFDGFMDT